jgi:DNA repair protein RadC
METLTDNQKAKLLNSRDVYAVMQPLLLRENTIRKSKGHSWVIGMNSAHHILFVELVGMGTVNRMSIAPKEIFRMAIYKMAVKMILVNSCPEGTIEISEADRTMTALLIKAGERINIEVVDHLLITEKDFVSLAQKGIVSKLKRAKLPVLSVSDQEQLEELQSGTETMLALAIKMKSRGYDVDEIKEMTGLRKTTIAKL